MSRRPPNPTAERTAQNQQALKALVKLESNKSCADCKKNKHPRWASWNLGIFVCIRCSGIHRGMGTHISRVKSVDLDSWTDEQTQSMLKWGNARANKYWEAKLAPGHVPAETKIENFIRTKYDSKRWVMDGPMPDPTTLGVDDADAAPPTSTLRSSVDRSAARKESSAVVQPPRPQVDLFGDDPSSIPRPSTTEPVSSFPPPTPPKSAVPGAAATAAPPRAAKPADSLLGFDFFGGAQSAPPSRQSTSTPPAAGAAQSRPDLKQSILSLYASAPRPTAQTQPQHGRSGSGAGPAPAQSGLSGLDDAFGGLTFGSSAMQSPPASQQQPSAFSSLASPTSQGSATSSNNFSFSGGNFFDAKPSSTPRQSATSPPPAANIGTHRRTSSGFGDFEAAISPSNPAPPQVSSGNFNDDPFGFSSPPITSPPPVTASQQPKMDHSPFNLSSPAAPTAKSSNPPAPAASSTPGNGGIMNMDPWGSNDVWASSNNNSKATATSQTTTSSQPPPIAVSNDFGWGDSSTSTTAQTKPAAPPKVTEDEDFGGWSSNIPPQSPVAHSSNPPKPAGGMGGGDDLFGNVWE